MPSVKILGSIALCSCLAMFAAAAEIPGAEQLEAVGKWPINAIMGFVALGSVYLMYKQSLSSAQLQHDAAKEFVEGMREVSATMRAVVSEQNALKEVVRAVPCVEREVGKKLG